MTFKPPNRPDYESMSKEQLIAILDARSMQEFVDEKQDELGRLAMMFRSGRHDRGEVVKQYAAVVDALIATKNWHEIPAFEDQLPNEFMPKAFDDYWLDENLSRGMPG